MLIRGIKYMFCSFYKLAIRNYGDILGALIAMIYIMFFVWLNILSIIITIDEMVMPFVVSMDIVMGSVLLFVLVFGYFLLIHNKKYEKIVADWEKMKKNKIWANIRILLYMVISFGLYGLSIMHDKL